MILAPDDGISYWSRQAHLLGGKVAADSAGPSYAMTGLLYVSDHGGRPYGLLSVPNALVRGIFDGLHEPGIELPLQEGRLNAHITVFRPEELELLGGPSAIANDRGKPFRYSLGRLITLSPDGWPDIDRCWVVRVHSPELQALRRSHGLSSLPNSGEYDFHITCAVRHKGVLARNEKTKAVSAA